MVQVARGKALVAKLRAQTGVRDAEETRELLEAGWEERGTGPKAIWRGPGGGRWYARYQALIELRRQRFAGEGTTTPSGDAS